MNSKERIVYEQNTFFICLNLRNEIMSTLGAVSTSFHIFA